MLGIFKKCLISLSVVFGGFGVNLGSSVIDVSNSTNVFKSHLKQANSSSSSTSSFLSYQVGDTIAVDGSSFIIKESNTKSGTSSSFYVSSLTSSFVYVYFVGISIDDNSYYQSYFSVNTRVAFSSGSGYHSSSRNSVYVSSSNLSFLNSPNSSGGFNSPLLLSFKQPYNFSCDGYKGSYRLFLLEPFIPFNPVTDSISIIVSGLTEFGKGLGTGISDIVTAMMYTGEGASKALSPFFVVVLVFAAIALCVSLTTLLFNWLRNLGGK